MAEDPLIRDLPLAQPAPPRSRLYVWILPALVVAGALFFVIREQLAEGVPVEITFRTADDLEPHNTKLRFKAVEIGEVTAIRVSKDRRNVIVQARIHRSASDYLVSDTRFWVVRPRVSAGNVSGLGTLVSGAYIGVDVGHSTTPQRHFVGLEVPPVLTSGMPGREFVLEADNLGSLALGSEVLFRHIPAGQVVAYAIGDQGKGVAIRVFINSPYDRYVTPKTRFWQASGIDMSADSSGVHLRTESLASIIEGGIAFQPFADPAGSEAPSDTRYRLFDDEEHAQREPGTGGITFVMNFQGSLRGLNVGAPVDLRGIGIGEVRHLSIEYDRKAGVLRFPVEVQIYPHRIRGVTDGNVADTTREDRHLIDGMIAHGMRAELKSGNLLSGSKYISVDVHRDAPRVQIDWGADPPLFPTAAGALEEIQDSVGDLAKKLDHVPYAQLAQQLSGSMKNLQSLLERTQDLVQRLDTRLAPQAEATLEQARGVLESARHALAPGGPGSSDLAGTLEQLSRAAQSVQALADYLERHPESLLRGKPRDTR